MVQKVETVPIQDMKVGVVGAGVMGQGIVQTIAQAGIEVALFDSNPEVVQQAQDAIGTVLWHLADRGKIGESEAQAASERIHAVTDLCALGECDIIIEAIVENLDAKRQLFQQLESVVSRECILASNTSSLSVTAIAAGCQIPQRVAGFHCFNPVPLMKLVEVIDGALTAPSVGQTLSALATRMGHAPIRAQDTPGFVVNHAGRGLITESLRLIDENVTDFARADAILREGVGFRLGPFELMDLTGLDVSLPVMESIYAQYYQEPRYRPSAQLRRRLEAGLLGRKAGRGFYAYPLEREQGGGEPLPEIAVPPVWISPVETQAQRRLGQLVTDLGGSLDWRSTPGSESLCLVTPLGQDATTAALEQGLDPSRVLAVDMLTDLSRHRVLMATPVTSSAVRQAAVRLFGADQVAVSMIRDSGGFVAQRVLAMIINIACDMAQQRVASPEDIDRGVTLGLGYPRGPLAWGDLLGPKRVLAILENLLRVYNDPRYRPSPWLSRRARLGVSLLRPEDTDN